MSGIRSLCGLLVAGNLVACSPIYTLTYLSAESSRKSMVGRDVGAVEKEMEGRGLSCQKPVVPNERYPENVYLMCSINERAIMCPSRYTAMIQYDPKTRLVLGYRGDKKDNNCF